MQVSDCRVEDVNRYKETLMAQMEAEIVMLVRFAADLHMLPSPFTYNEIRV